MILILLFRHKYCRKPSDDWRHETQCHGYLLLLITSYIYTYIYIYIYIYNKYSEWRSSPLELLSLKHAPKNTTKSIEEHPRRSATPTRPPCSFNEVALQRERSNINKSSKPPSKRAPPKDCTRLYSKIQISLK